MTTNAHDNSVLEQVWEAIEREHQDAVRAYEKLKRYLTGSASEPHSCPAVLPAGGSEAATKTARVLACLPDKHKSAKKIANETGLDVKQVRGVLYDPKIKQKLDVVKIQGVSRFKLKAAEE